MKFFRYFPRTVDGAGRIITNISKKIVLSQGMKDTASIYYSYFLKDGERLDTIAKRRYGSEEYQWIIMLVNNMMDPRENIPLSHSEFNQMIEDTYGSVATAQTTIHHYEDVDGNWVDDTYAFARNEITVYDYEESLNEAKREIKLVRPEFIPQFEEELRRVMS